MYIHIIIYNTHRIFGRYFLIKKNLFCEKDKIKTLLVILQRRATEYLFTLRISMFEFDFKDHILMVSSEEAERKIPLLI